MMNEIDQRPLQRVASGVTSGHEEVDHQIDQIQPALSADQG